jgi:hydrogenase expression/formation protein HypE
MERLNKILLSHGSGGRLMHDLIKGLFVKELKNPFLSTLDDASSLNIGKEDILFTTDSYVVNPIFFPGGDIGKLSMCGTVNDLAVSGARPLYISIGMIIEEGFGIDTLKEVVRSIKKVSRQAGVNVVTGDMKVVEKGSCDKLFINTSGVGIRIKSADLSLRNTKATDVIIVSGALGQHGVSILASREELNLRSSVKSDCAPLNGLVSKMLNSCDGIRFMRDPTRGGLATTLNEFVDGRDFGIVIDEEAIPLSESVKGACELLGFDPLYMANEGRAVVIASKRDANRILRVMRRDPLGKGARIIGEVVKENKGKVLLRTRAGGLRLLRMLTGEQLPRIC